MSKEVEKEIPLSDDELAELSKEEIQLFLELRNIGYSDRKIKCITELIRQGLSKEDTLKMFPASMAADRIEKLAGKLMKNMED